MRPPSSSIALKDNLAAALYCGLAFWGNNLFPSRVMTTWRVPPPGKVSDC